jgi:ATP-dependent protease ClpP protease subunit
MATVIHQAGTLRVIEPGCSYLIHDVSGESFGSLGNMQDTMDWLNKLNAMLHRALAAKAKITLAEVAELGKRRDGWFMPEEILGFGLADTIGYAFNATIGMPLVSGETITPAPVAKAARTRKPRTS